MRQFTPIAATTWSVVVVLVASGCSVIPQSPPPLPESAVTSPSARSSTVPTPAPSSSPTVEAVIAEDGFSEQEHAAVRIRARTCDAFTVGSGFMLDSRTIITNRHVVEEARTITLSTYDGQEFESTSSVVADFADLALIRVDEPLEFAAPLADAGPEREEILDVVGFPLGRQLTTTSGPYLGQVPDEIGSGRDDVDLIQVHAEQGNSGSAVYDADGDVVGVLYATDESGESFAVTLESLKRFLENDALHMPNEAECG